MEKSPLNTAAFVLPGQLSADQVFQALRFPEGLELFREIKTGKLSVARDALRNYCLLSHKDEDWPRAQLLKEKCDEWSLNSAMGCLLGNLVGDALGAPMEFRHVSYTCRELTEMGSEVKSKFSLKPGQWTDDGSMALCLADCLLVHDVLSDEGLKDLRLRFLAWWELGYNNAFSLDESRRGSGSVGLGGNISMSFNDFLRAPAPFTSAGDKDVSGNGSVMRNAAVCCRFWRDSERAMEQAARQSRATHQGEEAAECCRLLALVCTSAAQRRPASAREHLDGAAKEFRSEVYSVACLARSEQEERRSCNEGHKLEDRDWNWKRADYRYSPTRSAQQPGYVGSYAMDAMAMALHCLYHTVSAKEALLRIANLCGDADSVAAVGGQMAGSLYGMSSLPSEWVAKVEHWAGQTVALRALKLYEGKRMAPLTVSEVAELQRMDSEFYCSTVELGK